IVHARYISAHETLWRASSSKMSQSLDGGAFLFRFLTSQPSAHTWTDGFFDKLVDRDGQREGQNNRKAHSEDRGHLIAHERDEPPAPVLMDEVERVCEGAQGGEPLPVDPRQARGGDYPHGNGAQNY